MGMAKYFESKDKTLCCGCRNCAHVCQKACISMAEDEEGFLYPVINKTNCTNCGRCLQVCPLSNLDQKKSEGDTKVFCAWAKDAALRKQSSSGGLFSVLASLIIKQGGVVFGAGYDEKLTVAHSSAQTLAELKKLRGSKYVQSDLNNTFLETVEYLKKGTAVLYSGTPCQIAALKAYLGKPYDQLLLVDLICHGVPSPKLFEKYLDHLAAKHRGIITNFTFRNKSSYNTSLGCAYTFRQKTKQKTKLMSWYCSPYFYGFEQSLLSRPLCYNCEYANPRREGDITLGDFWGAQAYFHDVEAEKGLSVMLLNSAKAEEIFAKIKGQIECRESTFENASRKNKNLLKPAAKPEVRGVIYNELYQGSFKEKSKKYLRPQKYYRYYLASRIPQKLKTFVKLFVK